MAHLTQQHRSTFSNFVGKIKTGAEVAGVVKSIWDVGSTIYSGIRAAAPIVGAIAAAI